MAAPNVKLAESLKILNGLQNKYGTVIKSDEMSRVHRERLIKTGFLQKVLKGWYIISVPESSGGGSTLWYSSFWNFCSRYLQDKFKKKWCVSPEQSLILHSGNLSVPKQLIIRAIKANNTVTPLPYNTSIVNIKSSLPDNSEIVIFEGMRLLSSRTALVNCSEKFFLQYPAEARIALAMIRDASEILSLILDSGRSVVAGRLAGAFRNIGKERIAGDIMKTMKGAGYDVRESDPFDNTINFNFPEREISPYVIRVKLLWEEMRKKVPMHFPVSEGLPQVTENYLNKIREGYTADAYHSLSIEGYKVTPELIERVASGEWNPEYNEDDRKHKDALAAKGYWLAFQSVIKSIEKVLKNANPGDTVYEDHSDWFREMFSPSVSAGILKPSDLAGYRNTQVYIRNSSHIPMNCDAVRGVMPVFFELLKNEKVPAVRAVLGHFFFVYIHPYMDGNGRIGRFLMNVMLASGGYPWTVIPVEKRDDYIYSLEKASAEKDIVPFTKFLAELIIK